MNDNGGRTASVGRDGGGSRQLDTATEAIVKAGSHSGLLVVGPRGMGKSTLVDALEQSLEGEVIRVRGLRNVPTVPYGAAVMAQSAMATALGLPTVGAGDDVESVRRALSRRHPSGDVRDDEVFEATMASAFEQALRLTAGREPVYLLVDDVDHVDTASRLLFARLAARTSSLPGGVVCTATREHDVPELHDFRRLELKPLTVPEIVEVAETTRALTPPASIAQRILDLTDGRPAVVQELVEQLAEAQLLGASLIPTTEQLGDAARAAVADVLGELPPPTLEALHLVVASGTRSTDLVSRVLLSLGGSLEDLVDDGALVGRAGVVRPASGLLERHLRATTTSQVRRRAARAVLDSCAGHLDATQEAFSRAVATSDTPGASTCLVPELVAHALRVVRSSSSREAGDRARRLLAAAWPHCTPEVRGILCAAEAQVALHDGYLVDALAVGRAAIDGFPGGPGRVALARVVQNASLVSDEAVSASLALDTLDQADPSEQHEAEAFTVETSLMLLAVGRPVSAQTLVERLGDRRATFSDELRAELDYVLARTGASADGVGTADALHRWAEIRAEGPTDRVAPGEITSWGRSPWEAVGLFLYALRHEGEVQSARAVLTDLPGTARSRYERLLFDLNHAMIEFARGNYLLAVHHVEKMSQISDLGSFATSLRVGVRVGSAVAGDVRGSVDAFLQPSLPAHTVAGGLGPTLLDVRAETTRGVYFLAAGESDQALEHLERAHTSLFLDDDERSALPDAMAVVVLPVALARAYVAEGRTEDARRVAPGCDSLVGHAAWMSAAAQDLVDAVLRTPAGEAVQSTERVTAWSTDERLSRPARDHLRQVLSAPTGSRAEPLPRRRPGWQAERPERAAVPLEVRSVLSDRELEVALLVARGMRNKEISAQVFLSVRTVEATLTRVFRKVDVRSRTELVSRLGGSTAVLSGDVAR